MRRCRAARQINKADFIFMLPNSFPQELWLSSNSFEGTIPTDWELPVTLVNLVGSTFT